MSTATQASIRQPATAESASLLDAAIQATKQTEPDRAQALLRTFTEEALQGTVTFSRNMTITLTNAIAALDQKLSR
jgi:type VI secretion system protein ImpC